MIICARRLAASVLAALPLAAGAADLPPEFGRYLPRYPGIYYTVSYAQDPRDSSFDRNGTRQGSASPTVPGASAYPERRSEVSFVSYFPLFEDAGIPYFSSRVHSARLTLRYGRSHVTGAMADYLATNPEFAPRSSGNDSGIGDVGFEFGSFILGGQDWRTRKDNPFALVLLGGIDLPVGDYQQTAPATIGSNRIAYGAKLGMHWRPWSGGFVEAGAGGRGYSVNQDPNFGALAPSSQGNDRLLDLSLTQRLFRSAYLGLSATDRHGGANSYRNPRYAPNAPTPDPAPQGGTTESFPIPGTYYDEGTALRAATLTFSYFVTQRLAATLDWTHPLSGRSGQPLVEFRQRQCPPDSQAGASSCSESDQGPVVVDGQGAARAYASNSLRLAVSYNFGNADLYTCTGCER